VQPPENGPGLPPAYRLPPPRPRGKSFLAALFDARFTADYLTPRIVKAAYILIIAFTIGSTSVWVLWSLYLPAWTGWLLKGAFVLGGPVAALIFLTLTRIALEYAVVIFAINDKLSVLVSESEKRRD
jgi:hypothetical protein